MNPSRRSQLREDLREDSDRLTALAERDGTPLLVLQPHLVARRYRLLTEKLQGFRLHYAVKALPPDRALDDRRLRRRVRRRQQR